MVSGLEHSAFNTDGKLTRSLYFPETDLFKFTGSQSASINSHIARKPYKFLPEIYDQKTSSEIGKFGPDICRFLGKLHVPEILRIRKNVAGDTIR